MSNTSRAMALAQPQSALPSVADWELMQRMCQAFQASKLYPNVKDVAQAITIVQTGHELGVPPSTALRAMHIIEGKPTASAELLAALIYRDHGDQALKITESTNERCVLEYRRRGWDSPGTITFTMEDAKAASLLGKQYSNWSKYPRAMLRSRAISEAARTAFQDSILGLYTTEEMAPGQVMVTESGEVVYEPEAAPTTRVVDIETGEIIDGHAAAPDGRIESLRAEVAAGLSQDREAGAKLPKTADEMTPDELEKTLAWLRKRAVRAAQPVTKVQQPAERAETAQDAPEPPDDAIAIPDDMVFTTLAPAPSAASNGLSTQAITISKAIGKATDLDTVDWALDDARQAFEAGHISDRERETLATQGELKKASLAKPALALLDAKAVRS